MTNWPKEIFKILMSSKDKGIQDGISELKLQLQKEMDDIVKEVQIINKHFTKYITIHALVNYSNEELSLRIHYPYGFSYAGSEFCFILAKTPEIKEIINTLLDQWREKNSKLGEIS